LNRRKLRFLFVQPHFHRHYVRFFPVYEPLHGLLLGAVAGDLADTRIFDRRFDTDQNLMRLVRDYQPDIVGFTVHTAGEIFSIKHLAALVKKTMPRCLTIVGGQHATLLPEDLFGEEIDLVCIGPGEETFREVVEALAGSGDLTSVCGLAVRDGENYVITPPRIVCAGQFDRSLLPPRYLRHYSFCFEHRTTVYTITTAGCPHRCKFCSLWAANRGIYRRREPAEIVEDIASQAQPYVHLTDDNTFDHAAHAHEIARLLKKRGLRKKILAYARSDTILRSYDLLKEWREAGLGALVVGMEAVSDRQLQSINKRASVEVNVQAHRILEELGIENWAHFVIMPEFSREDFQAVWDFVDRLQITYPVFCVMTPVPGTPLFFEMKAQQKITCFDYGFYNLQYMVAETKLPKEEWYRHFVELYRKSCSWSTLRRRTASPAFHWRPALGRALIFGRSMRLIEPHYREQIEMERSTRYEEIEAGLPPSLRRDYKPDKYYNASTLSEVIDREDLRLNGANRSAGAAAQPPAGG
jgi:hopanoid C-3 methylase